MNQPNDLPLEIDIHAVHGLLKGASGMTLLDCREADEHSLVHIKEAKLLPMSELQARYAELLPLKDQHLVVHCHHGGRSMRVTQWLREQGFTQVQSMAGGIDQWAVEIDKTLQRY
ncbi:MAG: rhodanese-like domain-containing protein [Planctomycetota bacterium]|nr:rhodanese-like domain-containing protein [Planctomycetota bacterium]